MIKRSGKEKSEENKTPAPEAVVARPVEATTKSQTVSMACNYKLGHITIDGPVTGKTYTITNTGTPGIDIRDAEAIAASKVPFRCVRTGEWVEITPAGIIN